MKYQPTKKHQLTSDTQEIRKQLTPTMRNKLRPYNSQEIQLRHFVAQLASEAKEKSLPQEVVDQKIKAYASDKKLPEEYVKIKYNDRRRIPVPHGALNNIATIAQQLSNEYGERAEFPYFVKAAQRPLYIALLILGADGRSFPFSRLATAKAFQTTELDVGHLLLGMRKSHRMEVVQSGIETGGPTYYVLDDELKDAWANIGSTINVSDATPTGDLIRENFRWLFVHNEP